MLDGELPAGTTVMVVEKFPSMAALEAFYFSPEYQSAIPFRRGAFKMNFLVALDGISEAELEARQEAGRQEAGRRKAAAQAAAAASD